VGYLESGRPGRPIPIIIGKSGSRCVNPSAAGLIGPLFPQSAHRQPLLLSRLAIKQKSAPFFLLFLYVFLLVVVYVFDVFCFLNSFFVFV